MKKNKFLLVLALCAALHPTANFGSKNIINPKNPSLLQQWTPQFLQDWGNYASQKTSNAYNTINAWSLKKKTAVLGVIIGTLTAIYNKDQLIELIKNIVSAQHNETYKSNYLTNPLTNEEKEQLREWCNEFAPLLIIKEQASRLSRDEANKVFTKDMENKSRDLQKKIMKTFDFDDSDGPRRESIAKELGDALVYAGLKAKNIKDLIGWVMESHYYHMDYNALHFMYPDRW